MLRTNDFCWQSSKNLLHYLIMHHGNENHPDSHAVKLRRQKHSPQNFSEPEVPESIGKLIGVIQSIARHHVVEARIKCHRSFEPDCVHFNINAAGVGVDEFISTLGGKLKKAIDADILKLKKSVLKSTDEHNRVRTEEDFWRNRDVEVINYIGQYAGGFTDDTKGNVLDFYLTADSIHKVAGSLLGLQRVESNFITNIIEGKFAAEPLETMTYLQQDAAQRFINPTPGNTPNL